MASTRSTPAEIVEAMATPASEIEPVKLVNREFVRNPYPALERLREQTRSAVPLDRLGLVMWMITRYDDVKRLLADRAFKKDVPRYSELIIARSTSPPERVTRASHQIMRGVLTQDDDDHVRLRGLVQDWCRPERAAELRPRVESIADELLDAFDRADTVDLVSAYSTPLAATVTSEMLGIPPEDRHEFPAWWNSLLTGMSKDEIEAASRNLGDFCERLWQRARAGSSGGLVGHLERAERAGQLNEEEFELTSMVGNFLIGGMEPSTAIASGVALLLHHPDELARVLADPALMPSCVEEVLRCESPFRIMSPRFSADEFPAHGVTIAAGEMIVSCVASANRDPRQFPEPDRFDVARRPNPHLSFGYGPHYCIGVHHARLVTSVALERFLARFPRSRLAVPWDQLRWRPGTWMRRLDALPVVVD
jgi:cytochrome P450 PksS